jgi:16S rRNA (uracil1498-N3)-methyltransferase
VRRFFLERIQTEDGLVRVTGSEARHMIRVLRMGPGDRLVLMDGSGARHQAVIRAVGRDRADLLLERTLPSPSPSPLEITVCPSLLKSRPMDLLIRKASELGVAAVQPYTSSRSVVQLEGKRLESRLRHWGEIARNAAKQADRAVPARVDPPVEFDTLLARWGEREACKVILWETESARDLKGFLRREDKAGAVAAVVGPEGGFRPEEVRAAGEAGFSPVSLGRRILRAETAVLAVATLFQYEWGDLSLETPGG